MQKTVSVFLVDDHTVVRTGLKSLIERIGDYKIVREFENGRELVDEIPFNPEPDLIIMDLTMPEMDGADTMRWFVRNKITYPVLILTLDTSEERIIELFKLGIRGYLPKTCTAATLKKAITDVVESGYYHNELMTKALTGSEEKQDEKLTILKQLTDREIEFLQHVCHPDEFTYDNIAAKMGVSRRTVDGYRESIFSKFDIKSKTGLVMFAIKYKIVSIAAPQ